MHGDLATRNLLIRGRRCSIIDFSHASMKEDIKNEKSWERLMRRDREELDMLFAGGDWKD